MSVYRLGDLCEMGAHGRCAGGEHQEGLLGGWDCSCRCHRQQDQAPRPETRRKSYLSTRDFHSLHQACVCINDAFGTPPHLVGSATERPDYRDIDLRLLLPDDEYDAMFSGEYGRRRWSLLCWLISDWLHRQTGLPVDFQIQRRTNANEKHKGTRRQMGIHASRLFAGGGDTPYSQPSECGATDHAVTEAVGPNKAGAPGPIRRED